MNAYNEYAHHITSPNQPYLEKYSAEKTEEPSFLKSLVDDVIEDWNAYNECKDREEALAKKNFKPNAVESLVRDVSFHILGFFQSNSNFVYLNI